MAFLFFKDIQSKARVSTVSVILPDLRLNTLIKGSRYSPVEILNKSHALQCVSALFSHLSSKENIYIDENSIFTSFCPG